MSRNLTVSQRADLLWENHETEILHEDNTGLYRRITVQFFPPLKSLYLSVMTWPYHLAITGTFGCGWLFMSTTPDLLKYFAQADKDPATGETLIPFDEWAKHLTLTGQHALPEYEDDFQLACHLLHRIAKEYQQNKENEEKEDE